MRALSHVRALFVFAAVAAFAGAASHTGRAAEGGADTKAPLIYDARIVGDEARTRFVADMTSAIDVSVFTLSDPYRVIIDIPEVRKDLANTAAQPTGEGENNA